MDLVEFQNQLTSALSQLEYIQSIEIYRVDKNTLKGKAIIRTDLVLTIRFRVFETILTLSFTLLLDNNRIWGLDKDNRIGWHIHPLNDISVHEPIEEKTIQEIVGIIDNICRSL